MYPETIKLPPEYPVNNKRNKQGTIFQLKNGNRYYNDEGNIKPLGGGGYVDLSRGAAKVLGIMNEEGLDSKQLKIGLASNFRKKTLI